MNSVCIESYQTQGCLDFLLGPLSEFIVLHFHSEVSASFLSSFLRKAWVPCCDIIFICGDPAVQALPAEEIIFPPFGCLCPFVKALYYRFHMVLIILLIPTALKTLTCIVPIYISNTVSVMCPILQNMKTKYRDKVGESDGQYTDACLVADDLCDVTNLSSLQLFPQPYTARYNGKLFSLLPSLPLLSSPGHMLLLPSCTATHRDWQQFLLWSLFSPLTAESSCSWILGIRTKNEINFP